MAKEKEKEKEPIIILRYQGDHGTPEHPKHGNWIPMIPARDLSQEMIDRAAEAQTEFETPADVIEYCLKSKLYKSTRAISD